MSDNSKNIVTARIDASGNVVVGDNNVVINLKEAAQYKALQAELSRLDEKFEKIRAKIEKYPDDEDFKVELLRLSEERNEKQQESDTLTRNVLKLAEEFCNLPINTQRLEQARKHFQTGEFAAFGQFKQTNKPFIFTYFKDAEVNTGSLNRRDVLSLLNFQEKLDQLGHFYTRYTSTEDLLFKFGNQLDKLAETGFLELDKQSMEAAARQPAVHISQSKNVVTGSITSGGNVTIGDNNRM